jgi:predicted RecA/RadA family phage recombinase
MDPRQHVNPGDPIRLAASQINGLNRLLTLGGGFAGEAGGEQPTPYTWVMAKNNTGSTVARWGVLAITGMHITPGSSSGATSQFEQLPVVAGGTPSATTTAWCVAVEPIESGKIGRVAVGGVVQLKAADLGKASGAHVLWKDSNWALIRMQAGVVRGTFSGTWAKGSTTTVTDAVVSGATYTAKNYIATLSGSACLIAYVADEWVLVGWDWHSMTGYSASTQQVLTHAANGGLAWVSTTACT